MGEDQLRLKVLGDIPSHRLADLGARAARGALTDLELLALSVLRGGANGEESTPALLDAALATYCHGSYRVPVRVVADWKRAKVIITPACDMDEESRLRAAQQVKGFITGSGGSVMIVPAGSRVDVYEAADAEEAGVTISPQKDTGNG